MSLRAVLFLGLFWAYMLTGAGAALADCANPPAPAGTIIHNEAFDVFQGCNANGQWISFHQNPIELITAPSNCMLDEVAVEHGTSLTFYSANIHANCASIALSRLCTDGTLDGDPSFSHASCGNASSCTLDGVTLNHGQSHNFYSAALHADCDSVMQSRTCNNGALDGDGTFNKASCAAPANCSAGIPFPVTVLHGQTRKFYCGTYCHSGSSNRTCNNGNLSGNNNCRRTGCTNYTPR